MPLSLPSPVLLNYGSPVNWNAPLNRGLVAWWKVLPQRYGGASWLDLAGRNHAAFTSMGSSSATSGWGATQRPGGQGELRFPGSGSPYLSVPDSPSLRVSVPYTIALWCRRAVAGTLHSLLGKRLAAGSWTTVNLSILATNVLRFEAHDNIQGSFPYWTSTTTIPATAWTHVAVVFRTLTFTSADVDLYLNGAKETSVTFTTNSYASGFLVRYAADPLVMGITPADSLINPHNGSLDDLRLWQRALTDLDVQTLYRTSLVGARTELRWTTLPLCAPDVAASILPEMIHHGA